MVTGAAIDGVAFDVERLQLLDDICELPLAFRDMALNILQHKCLRMFLI